MPLLMEFHNFGFNIITTAIKTYQTNSNNWEMPTTPAQKAEPIEINSPENVSSNSSTSLYTTAQVYC